MRDSGKLKPSGSRSGPCTSTLSNRPATYVSISVVRISVALKRVRNQAGMAAQAMPPSMPASIISGSNHAASTS